ncbi:MAG: hypothetical protein U9Q15_00090 [Patescibacteria group bacterium]|nr:hypothetical protein [Patescibacteria group bacterium]
MFIGGDTKPLFNQMWDKAGRDANKELDRLGFYINPDLMSHTSRWEWFKDRISRIPISIQDRDGEVLINNNYVDHITDAYNYIEDTIEDWFEDDVDTTDTTIDPLPEQTQAQDMDEAHPPVVSQPNPVLAPKISTNMVQDKATRTEKRNKMNVDLSNDLAVTTEKKIDYSTESMMIFTALANAATTINRAACDETHRDAISGSMGGYVASDDDLYRSPDALAQDLAREATVDYQNTQMIIAETNLEIQDLEAAYDQLESDCIKAKKDIESLSGDEKKEATQTVLDLEREMTDIENKIAYAKQANTLQSKDYQARSSSYSTDSSFGSSQKHFNGQDPSKTYDSTLSRPSSDICRTLDKSIKKLQVKLR